MANKNLVVGATLLFCAAVFAQSTPSAKPDTAASAIGKQTVTTSRDADAGLATGKNSNAPGAADAVSAPRDHASGQASGKREAVKHPAKIEVPDLKAQAPTGTHHLENKNILHRDIAARDAASGQATGKREASDKKVDAIAVEHEVKSPRDSSTGLATGKRMHKPPPIRHEAVSGAPVTDDAAA